MRVPPSLRKGAWAALACALLVGVSFARPEGGQAARSDDSSKPWALQPPARPPLPSVQHTGWARNPIDLFVLAELEKAGLQPSPEAGRAALVRRATFDLTGLPPTPDEVQTAVRDPSPDWYEKVVDRLLASPA
ncbi:MAG TPA: DUF1549 domain-containing protein, partial [Gemmataceae bacterium]|nr:DUF1549 domain-containing protein [Gemmataceae bacterium]